MTQERQALEPSNPLPSFDARVWARSFMEHNAINPDIARDEETMVTWFAKQPLALASRDEQISALQQQVERLTAERNDIALARDQLSQGLHVVTQQNDALKRENAALTSKLLVSERFAESQRFLKDQNIQRWTEAQEKLALVERALIQITGQSQGIFENLSALDNAKEKE